MSEVTTEKTERFRVRQAEFIKAIVKPCQAPEPRPSIVFAGRSNVGKSSLINRVVNERSLARTSSTPGRTREIIFFDINQQYYFIDLPGYGFAKVPLELKRTWGPMMASFFKKAQGIRLVVILIDIRRTPNDDDQQMIHWAESNGMPYIFAVTKCDKLKRSELKNAFQKLQERLGMEDQSGLVPVSSLTGKGVDDLIDVLGAMLEAEEPDPPPEQAPDLQHEMNDTDEN